MTPDLKLAIQEYLLTPDNAHRAKVISSQENCVAQEPGSCDDCASCPVYNKKWVYLAHNNYAYTFKCPIYEARVDGMTRQTFVELCQDIMGLMR